MANEPARPLTGLFGGRCGAAGEPCEDADEPPPEASGEKLPPLFIALNEVRETDGLKDWISAGEASKIVKPLVSIPGG